MCLHVVPVCQQFVKKCVLMLAVQVWGSRGLPGEVLGQVPCTSWALAPAKGKCWQRTSSECQDT